jgi:hypothetical protein
MRIRPTAVHIRRAATIGFLAAAVMATTTSCLVTPATLAAAASTAKPVPLLPRVAQGTYPVADGRSYYLTGALTEGPKHQLIIVLGGIYLTPAITQTQTGWTAEGIAHDATVVYGISAPGASGWNASGCCGSAAATNVDDVAYRCDARRTGRMRTRRHIRRRRRRRR